MKGVNGVIGVIDLSNRNYTIETVSDEIYKNYLGGYGLGVWYLYYHQKAKVDPLGPENTLGIIAGLLNVTNIPLTGRFMAVAKSPLTGTWGDSNCGGHFGPKLMRAGFDGLFIKGIASSPVYIVVKDGKISIHDAVQLWGKTTIETEEFLKAKYPGAEVLSIGPAGENLALISCIITDKGRALGRSGLGAVMGSKKLKAIVAIGNKNFAFQDSKLLISKIKEIVQIAKGAQALAYNRLHKYGTVGGNELAALNGDTPIRNWNGIGIVDFGKENAKKLSGDEIIKDNVKSYACANCIVACGAWIHRKTRYGTVTGHRIEYEGVSLFGQALLNADLDSAVMAFELCNQYGLDIISTAAVIGFAMECYEKGLLTVTDIGFPIQWGDGDAIVQLVKMIGEGKGFGKILGLGVKRAAEVIGNNAADCAIHVHGQELPAHDPKYLPSLATTYISDPTPGRHTAGGAGFYEGTVPVPIFDVSMQFEKLQKYKYHNKGKIHALLSNMAQVQNALGFCMFSDILKTLPYIELIYATTGLKYTADTLLKVGERIQNLRQLFNVREGLKPSDFTLNHRVIGIPPQPVGPLKGVTVDVETMRREYYTTMQWDLNTGKPSLQKLTELDIEP